MDEAIQRGFARFSWLRNAAEEKLGKDAAEAFNLARNMVHGNAALLEQKAIGIAREGDLIRFLVAANQLAGARLGELCDDINRASDGSP